MVARTSRDSTRSFRRTVRLAPSPMATTVAVCARLRSRHPSIVNGLMADGAVRQISNNIDVATWWGLGTRADSEVLGEF